MWNNYALSLLRNLARRPLYAILNILGLSAGLATFLVLTLVVRHETSFDRWIPDAPSIYRLNQLFTLPGRPVDPSSASSGVILPLLQADYAQIVAGVRVSPNTFPMSIGSQIENQDVQQVDPSFFDVFALPLVQGDARNALDPGGAVMTQSIARKYFGTTAALGRTFTLNQNGQPRAYRVTAILRDIPENSSVPITILLPLTSADYAILPGFQQWGPATSYTYVKLRDAEAGATVGQDLDNFVRRRAGGQLGEDPTKLLRLQLVALPSLHFADATVHYTPKPGADARVVASLGVVGALALLIAVLNYVNLASAQAILRAREVAIRKVVGATRRALLVQFLGESLALSAVSGIAALALVELALPIINVLSGLSLRLDYGPGGVLPLLIGVVLLVGLAAGLYPALLISRFAPAPILASAKAPGGGRMGSRVRTALVIVQFAAAITFAICTLVVGAQTRFIREADRGFRRDGLILIESFGLDPARQQALLTSLAQTSGVGSVTLSDREPASTNIQIQPVGRAGLPGQPPALTREIVGDNYFQTYGVKLAAGRPFDPRRREDDLAGARTADAVPGGANIMLNVSGVKALGFASPTAAIGQQVQFQLNDGAPVNGSIIGIVQDVRFMSPREPVAPIFYLHDRSRVDAAIAAARYAGPSDAEMMARLKSAWLRVAPDQPFVAQTADGKLSDYFLPDERRARLFGLGAFVAMGLGCVGLFGVASFTTARRVKEVGIRKALGASSADVLRLMVGQFLRPVLLANLAAWPLAWFVLQAWLEGFDQRVPLTLAYFVIPTLAALVLAVITVAEQALRVARTAPAVALRYE